MKILTNKQYQELELNIVSRARKERIDALARQKEFYENQIEDIYSSQDGLEDRIKERLQRNIADSYISIEDYNIDLFFKDGLEAKVQDLGWKDSQIKGFKTELKEAQEAQESLLITIKHLRRQQDLEEAEKYKLQQENVKLQKSVMDDRLAREASDHNLKVIKELREKVKNLPKKNKELQEENDLLYKKLNALLRT